jgi:voltage-gated sodium channel
MESVDGAARIISKLHGKDIHGHSLAVKVVPDSCCLQLASRLTVFCESRLMEGVVIVAILAAAVCAGLETDSGDTPALEVLEIIILGIFVLEFILKVLAEGTRPWNYFRETINFFDFIVIVICFMALVLSKYGNGSGSDPEVQGNGVQTLRLLRLLRLLKLLDGIPQLRIIVIGVYRGLTSISFIFSLLMLVFYIYAIIGLSLFRENDPSHFKNLHTAMLSLFRGSTFEDWTDIYYINYYVRSFPT